jgi:hypothetical protein
MDSFIELVKSDVGVTIAWVCTVVSIFVSVFTNRKNKQLKVKINQITKSSTVDSSHDGVAQNGQKNVYTKNNSGGMKIDM